MVLDRFQRPLRDLRISVTDRCNFRCGYCMPANQVYRFLPKKELLSFEEITALAKVFAGMGVAKLRITGGEPLLRRNLPVLIKMLAQIEGIRDIALTTNGFYLATYAKALKEAGLHRITLSLDSLDPETFASLNGRGVHPQMVLDAMAAAADAGFPIKINSVIQKGVNDHEIVAMARLFREQGHTIRFIEFMDVGNLNGWALEKVLPSSEIVALINHRFPCEPIEPNYAGEVARRYRYLDGRGQFGLISSVTNPFCGGCTRARLSADGHLYTCLFANKGADLKHALRGPNGVKAVTEQLDQIWTRREDRYSELRTSATTTEKVEMFHIGG